MFQASDPCPHQPQAWSAGFPGAETRSQRGAPALLTNQLPAPCGPPCSGRLDSRGPVVPPARPPWAPGQTLEVNSFLQARPRAHLFLLTSPWPRDPGKLSLLPGLCFPVCPMGLLSTKAKPIPQDSPWRRDGGKKGSLTDPMTLVKSPRCPVPAKMKPGVS